MTAIPITSEGRALCGFVTQTNSVNTNNLRNTGWKDSGVADKMSRIWEKNWRPCYLYKNNGYASTLCLALGKKKKLTAPRCERFRSSVSCENNYAGAALTFPKMSHNLDGSLKILLKSFDCFLCLSFHNFFSDTGANSSLAGIWGYHLLYVYFSSKL